MAPWLLQCVILTLIQAPVSLVQAYCWEPGKNPSFTGDPIVEQVDIKTVRVSWFGLVEYRQCTDQFLVKYWLKTSPQKYELTELVDRESNSIDIEVIPKLEYQFQAVAREDKGAIAGVDWNKSPIVDFRTSAYNREVKEQPIVTVIQPTPGELDNHEKNIVKPSSDPQLREEEGEVALSIELMAIIVVCGVVFLLIVVGIIYKLACAQNSQEDDDIDDDEDDTPEKEKFEA